MVNIVGSLSKFLTYPFEAYILGLWGADRYFRTSSIGLSNTNVHLLKRTLLFLLLSFPKDRIKLRVYGNFVPITLRGYSTSFCKGSKNVKSAYHLYVNSRPLVREFFDALSRRNLLHPTVIYAYFAGRFDGDGCISHSGRPFCRIVYKNLFELEKDRTLLKGIKTHVYRYEKANTYCLYFSEQTLSSFLSKIFPYSVSGKL